MGLLSKDTAEIVESLVTAFAIVVGGGWAFWKWSLSEFLRRRREIPSFDGEIAARSVRLNAEKEAVTVYCRWRNCGSVPLSVNTKETRVTVYELPEGMPHGPFGPRLRNIPELHVRRPWEHWPTAVLEPETISEIQAHFTLPAGRVYVFACRLEAESKSGANKQVWVRELVWKSIACVRASAEPNNATHAMCEDARVVLGRGRQTEE